MHYLSDTQWVKTHYRQQQALASRAPNPLMKKHVVSPSPQEKLLLISGKWFIMVGTALLGRVPQPSRSPQAAKSSH